MPLEEILDRIIKDTEREVDTIIKESEERAKKILDENNARASSIEAHYESKANEDADTTRRQRTSAATLEGRYHVEQSRERIENEYLEALKSRIIQMRGTNDYLDYLDRAIREAKKILGEDAVVYLAEDDAKRMEKTGLKSTSLSSGIGQLGGTIVTSADGKMIIDLTFTEIIRRKNDSIRKIVREYING